MTAGYGSKAAAHRGLALGLLLLLLGFSSQPAVAQADAAAGLRLRLDEPRAFGYHVGDTVKRQLRIDVPTPLRLDPESLPAIGRQGPALELRSIERREERVANGRRMTVELEYQIFASPTAPRVYELPTFRLRFDGGARAEELRVESWPMVVSPLMPEEVSPRHGLGQLRPDLPTPLAPTVLPRVVVAVATTLALALSAYLGWIYLGVPWWERRQRPFGTAWRTLESERRRGKLGNDADGCRAVARRLHAALNVSAGRVLFAETVDAFVTGSPQFAPLRGDLLSFFERSGRAFFSPSHGPSAGSGDLRWLLDFARALRDAERGSA